MFRGQTAKLPCVTGINLSTYDKVVVTFKQDDIQLDFEKEQLEIDNLMFYVPLTQEQTLGFKANKNIIIQFKAKDADNNVVVSQPYNITLNEILNEVIL